LECKYFHDRFDLGANGSNPAPGDTERKAQLPKAPRPPTQTSARPSLKGMLTGRRGRDVGFAKSGFRPTELGNAGSDGLPNTCILALMGRLPAKLTAIRPAMRVSIANSSEPRGAVRPVSLEPLPSDPCLL